MRIKKLNNKVKPPKRQSTRRTRTSKPSPVIQTVQDKYPETAEREARTFSNHITDADICIREDFRPTLTFTIDPQNAQDFDDALSFKQLPNNLYEIGIHIADVTHYIKPDSSIDKEAKKRGTSVYLVDRVVPMLPEILCNEICSLRPNEDKLCFSVIFEMDTNAKIYNYRIRRTVIHSNHRFTYEEAQRIIESGGKTNPLTAAVLILNDLAKNLREKRLGNGAIDFDRTEVQFNLDENGKPLNVYFKETKDASKLVEEFMLLANRTVAEVIGKVSKREKAKTFVYRVHDIPDAEKMKNLVQFVQRFGYRLNISGTGNETSKNINQLLNQIQGTKEQNLIETIVLRAMPKAIYTTANIGHYGLAFEYYTHFTSPIRRYPDMMVHRLLERYLEGKRAISRQSVEKICQYCSEQETLAVQAERASIKAKQVEFMSDKIGNVFQGVISGVTEWGLYVELNENGCEGLIPMRHLNDDYYRLNEKSYTLTGKTTKRTYRLGDTLQIKVVRSDLEKRQLDFAPHVET